MPARTHYETLGVPRDASTDEIRFAYRALAQRLQISGTPTFVLEDELLRGYLPFDQLQVMIEEKRG